MISRLTFCITLSCLVFVSCGRSTKFCPTSHRFNDLSSCYILHTSHESVLIQHANLENSKVYLELVHNGKSLYYSLPKQILQLAPEGYTAIVTLEQKILINCKEITYKLESPDLNKPNW